ncbi:DUF2884 family protein [Xanthomonas campestris]|uniref:DUF2884 family protein n=1 Tax=Xanthomonas campestris TaxID=339 RepID=UPI0036D86919
MARRRPLPDAAIPDPEARAMRPSVFLLPLLWLVACAAQADTPTPQLSAQQCGISTSYDVLADTGGIWLRRKQGAPREIFFHGGELNVDHRPQPVSDADAQRLRALEHGTRALMPAVTAIARSVVDLSFDALGGVVQMLTGSARQARKVERLRGTALAQVEGTLGRGRWEQELFDARFEASVEHAAEALAGSLTRSVLWTVVTGRTDALKRRSAQLDAQMDQQLRARSEVLEAQAKALCTQVQALYALQQALDYRFDGKPLQLLEVTRPETPHTLPPGQDDAPASSSVIAAAGH